MISLTEMTTAWNNGWDRIVERAVPLVGTTPQSANQARYGGLALRGLLAAVNIGLLMQTIEDDRIILPPPGIKEAMVAVFCLNTAAIAVTLIAGHAYAVRMKEEEGKLPPPVPDLPATAGEKTLRALRYASDLNGWAGTAVGAAALVALTGRSRCFEDSAIATMIFASRLSSIVATGLQFGVAPYRQKILEERISRRQTEENELTYGPS
jgi:hypothetical protein